jgi:hypothetical protein
MRTGLVIQAQDGDDVAFTELVDLGGNRSYAIAYGILRDVELTARMVVAGSPPRGSRPPTIREER